jgi:hypothetical protein
MPGRKPETLRPLRLDWPRIGNAISDGGVIADITAMGRNGWKPQVKRLSDLVKRQGLRRLKAIE